MRHERAISQLLSLYRFFSFGIAVLLLQVVPLGTAEAPDLQTYLILSLVGVYTFFKVFSPLRWERRGLATSLILWGDLTVCIVLVLFTGGLDSGFLLYSLTPIISAALLTEERVALSFAALSSLSLIVSHLGLSQLSTEFAWIMHGNYLPLLVIFVMSCFLIAIVAYRTNLNIRQRIEKEAILAERRRLKQELHDGVAQALTYLNLKTRLVSEAVSSQNMERVLSDLDHIQRVVQHTYEDIRESIDRLSTEVRQFPLIPTLAKYVAEFGKSNNIQTHFSVSRNFPSISPVAEVQLLHIAQEALTNVRKHAEAAEAWVNLEHTPQDIRLKVKDNGRGFTLVELQGEPLGSKGLSIMKERAESLGGALWIASTPGQGAEITVSIPIEKVGL